MGTFLITRSWLMFVMSETVSIQIIFGSARKKITY
jgi:hypothetical protein